MSAENTSLSVRSHQPNFFFIGGMRCGSTTIAHLLDQHPQIYMSPVKEPSFYVPEVLRRKTHLTEEESRKLIDQEKSGNYRTADAYYGLFENVTSDIIGEASHYIYHTETASVIYSDCPSAKILISVRNPIDRLFSEYLLHLRRGGQNMSFRNFVDDLTKAHNLFDSAEKPTVPRLNKGLQAHLLKPWIATFGNSNVMVVRFDELKNKPQVVAQSIFQWLGVDASFEPEIVHTQMGGAFKKRGLASLFKARSPIAKWFRNQIPDLSRRKIRAWVYARTLEQPELDSDTRALLSEFYRDDVAELEGIMDSDLSHWLNPNSSAKKAELI